MHDEIRNEEQAIEFAWVFIEKHDAEQKRFLEANGKSHHYIEWNYRIHSVESTVSGWAITFWRTHPAASVDPPFVIVLVNRKDGETKLGYLL